MKFRSTKYVIIIMDDSTEQLSQHLRRIFRNKFIRIKLGVELRIAIFVKTISFT